MDVTVVIGTFGGSSWRALAAERAAPTAQAPVVMAHAETLHDARNGGLAQVKTEWVCFLDADDELEPGFFDAMATGSADVRVPLTRYVSGANVGQPTRLRVEEHSHECSADCTLDGNWLVVGSVVRTELANRIGGWRDFEWSEDWDFWVRCYLAGASFETVEGATYRAYHRPGSRNSVSRETRLRVHREIAAANGIPANK